MIYVCGWPCTIVRQPTKADMDKHFPTPLNEHEQRSYENNAYWIVRFEDGETGLYHLAAMQADGASEEVNTAIVEVMRRDGRTRIKERDAECSHKGAGHESS